MSKRILVVDDHVAVREGVARMLASAFPDAEFGFAGTSSEALQAVSDAHWSLVIIDINLPGRGGLDTVREIKARERKPRVLIYSVHGEDQFGLRALQAGADSYITKDSPADELIEAVRRLLEGRSYIGTRLAESLAGFVRGGGSTATDNLSDREETVLVLLASGRTPTDIAAELNLSIKTVSTYRARLLDKLGLKSTADLIRYAVGRGLVE